MLRALDAGNYRPVLTWYESARTRLPDDSGELIAMLEAASYTCRRDEVARLLRATESLSSGVRDADDRGMLARRREAVALESALDMGASDLAASLERLLEAARESKDLAVETRVRHLYARLAYVENDWIGMLARGKELVDIAAATRNQFTHGRALVHRGKALRELSRPDEAEVALRDGLRALEDAEDLRYRAQAEIALASIAVTTGRVGEACDLFEHAEATLRDLGIAFELSEARAAGAWAMVAAGRYDEAREKVRRLVELDKSAESSRGVAAGLKLLSCLGAVTGDGAEASRAAAELGRLAEISGNATDRFEARLVAARAGSRSGDAGAIGELAALVEEASAFDVPSLGAIASIYHAEALLLHDPVDGEKALASARAVAVEADPWVVAELAALERTREQQPIRVENGVVLINLNGELPLRERAQEVLDRALIRAALARTKGNYAKAGRLIGEKRWNMRFISIQKVGAPKHKTPRRAAAAARKMKKPPTE